MFEWFDEELANVKTPRFHRVDGPAERELRDAVAASDLDLPSDYKAFVLRYGNAQLYRRSLVGYRVSVFAGPRAGTLKGGTKIYHLGNNNGATAYVKSENGSIRPSIYEFEDDFEEKAAETFEEWLRNSCSRARKSYSKRIWAEILRGPQPFTVEEREIIETRRRILWRKLGVDLEDNQIVEVTNTADRVLPVLTIGARSTDKRLNGAVWLRVETIAPGNTATLHVDCYKSLVKPNEIELFSLPDPQPEEREYYRELQKAS